MPRFGAHLSVAALEQEGAGPTLSGPSAALARARELRCDCLQVFLRPNRQWTAPELTDQEVAHFVAAAKDAAARTDGAIHPIVSHAAYLINLAGPPEARVARGSVRQLSIEALKDELRRADRLGLPYLVLHPGSHLGDGDEAGLGRLVEGLDEALGECARSKVMILVETTAGQGTNIGYRFEHLAFILKNVACPERLGVCADTAHMFAAGYDLHSPRGYEATLAEFDRVIGLEHLRLWHLNDSLRELGSRVDRHEHIGRGKIGRAGFRRLVTDPRFAAHPMILETPKHNARGQEMDPRNLAVLRRLAQP
jgi:deoxyribonuclease-4